MESLGSVGTIVRIAKDIAGGGGDGEQEPEPVPEARQAKRMQDIGDLPRELSGAEAAAAATDAATGKLLVRLEETLRRALLLVRSCQDSGCPRSLIAGGRMADRFEVDGEIDRCLLDLGVANHILIARLVARCRDSAARTGRTTVTLRIGMPCDDSTDHIKRSIGNLQGVTDVVAGAASSKDQFRVTVTSDAGDIPSLLDLIKEKLNRNVELITAPADPKNTSNDNNMVDGKNYRRYATGDETKKEKPAGATSAAAANMAAGSNQALPQYAYLPFAVTLVPIGGDATSMHHVPSPYSYLPYLQGPPPGAAGDVVHAQRRQSNPQPAHFNSTTKKFGGAGDAVKDYGDRDAKKGNVTADHGADKSDKSSPIPFNSPGKGINDRRSREADPVLNGGVKLSKEWDGGNTTTATDDMVITAIGVPLHTVTAGVPERLVPPPSYGHGGYLPYAQSGHHAGHCCCQNNACAPSDAATVSYNHYSWYPDMFSDENVTSQKFENVKM